MSLAFIDCETTGLDPERHALWEIGLITATGSYRWVLELTSEELGQADSTSLAVGRYYERSTKALMDYEERFKNKFASSLEYTTDNTPDSRRRAAQENNVIRQRSRSSLAAFIAWEIGTSHLVGAVPSFDARFVGDFLRAHKFPPSWHYHLVDVETLAAGKLCWEPPWKSKDLYAALGIDLSKFEEHTAFDDAALAEVVYRAVMSPVKTEEVATETGSPAQIH